MYAVLSQRLALPQYLKKYWANSVKSLEEMHEQIAKHMRICVAFISKGNIGGIASSEPILSEAASRIMLTKKFSLPGALLQVLTWYGISPSDRGEIIVASFFTWARDQVVKNKPLLSVGQL
jgi:hypothetical protein